MARRSLRRRFLIGTIASSLLALALYSIGLFAIVSIDDADADIREGDSFESEVVELILGAMGVAAPLAIAAAVALSVIVSRKTAKPIDDAIRTARETTAHDLGRRLPVPEREDELRELVVSLNDLFVRLDDGFGALARFAADASHELRTPLAVMATELEVALLQPRAVEEWEATGRGTLEQLRRMSALVDGLLTLARAGADAPGARSEVNLIESVDAVVAQLSARAEAAGIELAGPTADGPRTVTGNPVTLETAIRNLVENALAATGRGGRVFIDVVAAPSELVVTVDDDGPGMGKNPEAMFSPFVSAPTTADPADRRVAGAGLGLAIARRIATAHDGRLSATTSPLGGARLTLAIPHARDA